MRRVALFSTYCDTEEKQNTLLSNLKKVKSLGMDTFVLTILPLPKEIHDSSDYVIYSKENPVVSIDQKSICSWRICKNGVTLNSFLPDYGYASLLQLKRLIDFSSSLDYDYYFTMIYDIIITPDIEKILLEGRECSFFKNPKVNTPMGGILTAFNKKNALKFSSLITEKSYYGKGGCTAEEWMMGANGYMCGKIEDVRVADSINLNDVLLVTNHSPFEDFNFFLAKDKDFKIFFYEIKIPISIKIETNLGIIEVPSLDDDRLIYIHENSEIIEFVKITYNGEERDVSYYFNSIIKSLIEGYNQEVLFLP